MEPTTRCYYLLLPNTRDPVRPAFVIWFVSGKDDLPNRASTLFSNRFPHATFDHILKAYHLIEPFSIIEGWTRQSNVLFVRGSLGILEARRMSADRDHNPFQRDGFKTGYQGADPFNPDEADAAYRAGKAGRDISFDDFFSQAENDRDAWRSTQSNASSEGWRTSGFDWKDVREAQERTKRQREENQRRQQERRAAPSSGVTDAYAVLYVTRQAPDEVCRAAFRALSLLYHPDKSTGDEAKMKDLNNSWQDIRRRRGI